jgi:hypothetical protein
MNALAELARRVFCLIMLPATWLAGRRPDCALQRKWPS